MGRAPRRRDPVPAEDPGRIDDAASVAPGIHPRPADVWRLAAGRHAGGGCGLAVERHRGRGTRPGCTAWRGSTAPRIQSAAHPDAGSPGIDSRWYPRVTAFAGEARQRHAERVGRGVARRRGRPRSRGRGAGTARRSPSPVRRGRHVARGRVALPQRVLGGHRGDLAGPGQVGHRGGVAAGEDLRVAGHGQVLVDDEPAAGSVFSPRSATSGSGRTPTHQISVRVGTIAPSLSRTPSALASRDGRAGAAPRPPARRSTRSAVRGQPLVELGQHPAARCPAAASAAVVAQAAGGGAQRCA